MLVILLSSMLSGCWTRSVGEKTGVIVKFAKEGMFFNSWEGELIRGGMNSGSGVFGKPFNFTVEDEKLIPIIQSALENQKEVRIHYHIESFVWPTRAEDQSEGFIDSIEVE